MKTLLLDIETTPHVADVWSLHNIHVSPVQLRSPSAMMSVAAKWLHLGKVKFWSVYHHDRDVMLTNIHNMMSEADAIITYNGKSFDIPILNREFVSGGFPPPSPSKQIDLYQVVRKHFRFASNKLEYISVALGLEGKVKHSGHQLWVDCVNGDKAAWKKMAEYNKKDVILLEELYDIIEPWIWNGPNAQLFNNTDGCPRCGSEDLRREGFAYLAAGKYQRFQCRGCNSWSRSSHREGNITLQGINPS